MNQANLTSEGFQNAIMNDTLTSIRDGVQGLSTQICNGFSSAEIAANSRQMADMNQRFALQSQLADCCCENRLGIANLGSVIQSEACANRTQSLMNTRDVIDSQTRGTQAVLDKLCQLELDGLKSDNANLRTQLNMANLAASQTAQTAQIESNIFDRLKSCPIPAQPVYGNSPIFTCGGNSGCGCGCGGSAF